MARGLGPSNAGHMGVRLGVLVALAAAAARAA